MSYRRRCDSAESFSLVRQAFLQADGLPFADVLSEDEIRNAFEAENVHFAQGTDDIYTPPLTLWAFLSQALHADKARACLATVTRVIVLCVALGRKTPSPDTGAYCRARAKLPESVLQRLVYRAADQLESRVPADWLWKGRHVKITDGTTLTAPDTAANQAVWPQSRSQQPGLGYPLLRMVVLFSLATGAVLGAATGPWRGKRTGEPALLRDLFDRLQPGDVLLGDCCFCSYFMLALLLARGVDAVVRQHQCRKTDFREGRRLGREDHLVAWQRPKRPEWMDEETYATIPETLLLRELKVRVDIRGFRVRQLVVVTTLANGDAYGKDDLAQLFRQRWHAELDLRNVKATLPMDDLRGKTPAMVRREIWVHWLAYNLIRKTMAQAALTHEKLPRQLSFAASLDAVVACWDHATVANLQVLTALALAQFLLIARHQVGDRPDRVEPRAVKRRAKPHPLLRKPRDQARAELLGGQTARY